MEARVEVLHGCGCLEVHSQKYDGRVRGARADAETQIRRGWPSEPLCIRCRGVRNNRLARGLFRATWLDSPVVIRALVRAAAVLGGTISRSPKSMHSLYVSGEKVALRISDHQWPGRRESLIAERQTRRGRWVSRLVPQWLSFEKAKTA